jgi:hypothetical protein
LDIPTFEISEAHQPICQMLGCPMSHVEWT